MPTPPNSLRRIWSATNRSPHRTWWGHPGMLAANAISDLVCELIHEARQAAPAVIVMTLNFFR
jgi:hypothetical protein